MIYKNTAPSFEVCSVKFTQMFWQTPKKAPIDTGTLWGFFFFLQDQVIIRMTHYLQEDMVQRGDSGEDISGMSRQYLDERYLTMRATAIESIHNADRSRHEWEKAVNGELMRKYEARTAGVFLTDKQSDMRAKEEEVHKASISALAVQNYRDSLVLGDNSFVLESVQYRKFEEAAFDALDSAKTLASAAVDAFVTARVVEQDAREAVESAIANSNMYLRKCEDDEVNAIALDKDFTAFQLLLSFEYHRRGII
jgi:hypothetical protein